VAQKIQTVAIRAGTLQEVLILADQGEKLQPRHLLAERRKPRRPRLPPRTAASGRRRHHRTGRLRRWAAVDPGRDRSGERGM